jgi:hypothetical protein
MVITNKIFGLNKNAVQAVSIQDLVDKKLEKASIESRLD